MSQVPEEVRAKAAPFWLVRWLTHWQTLLLQATRGWRLAGAWAVFFGVLAWMQLPFGQSGSIEQVQAHADGYGILNTLPGYGAEQAYAHLHAYTATAWRHYQAILLADLLLLIPAYVLGLAALIARLLPPRGGWHVLLLIPPAAGLFNLVEDLLIVGLHAALPRELPALAAMAGLLTATKALLLKLCLLAMALLLLHALLRRWRSRGKAR